ncbi:hypothetical protein H6P81_009445 [Aristolochia fimbriata]|uniref:Uncharacterized protein n=1 Tax=Aristolochia fimbriata TaxID=158543 RepID=A0AAV7EKW5_ARIFI|nr:hypothetical protein H6P81_009445 [Aristolochia fimbriata]
MTRGQQDLLPRNGIQQSHVGAGGGTTIASNTKSPMIRIFTSAGEWRRAAWEEGEKPGNDQRLLRLPLPFFNSFLPLTLHPYLRRRSSSLGHGELQEVSSEAVEERPRERQRGSPERFVRVQGSEAEDVGEVGGGDQRAEEEDEALVGLVRDGGRSGHGLRRGRETIVWAGGLSQLATPAPTYNNDRAAHQRLIKWVPSKNFINSLFPSYGLLNLNAQHNEHVIHQRLQELKKSTGSLISRHSSSSSSSSFISSSTTSTAAVVVTNSELCLETKARSVAQELMGNPPGNIPSDIPSSERPLIDLKEFLQ